MIIPDNPADIFLQGQHIIPMEKSVFIAPVDEGRSSQFQNMVPDCCFRFIQNAAERQERYPVRAAFSNKKN